MTDTTEKQLRSKPFLWLIDAEKEQIGAGANAFADWADCAHFTGNPSGIPAENAADSTASPAPDWGSPPDAIFFAAEIPGGANGEVFARLLERAGGAGGIPLLAVARLRSLAQAVAYFRAGAADYLSLPLEEEDARARFHACIERAANLSSRRAERNDAARSDVVNEEEDILAQVLPSQPQEENFDIPDDLLFADIAPDAPEDEPTPVDGLPIPTLWEELPCGLLVFDSLGNLVFANRVGLDLLGRETLAELQDALENNLAVFAAHGMNHRPLPDNQWPQLLAVKTRTPRSAVVSIQMPTPDKRRSWLRIDCQPHLADGKVARLSMTIVNLTGELPPLRTPENGTPTPSPSPARKKRRGRKQG